MNVVAHHGDVKILALCTAGARSVPGLKSPCVSSITRAMAAPIVLHPHAVNAAGGGALRKAGANDPKATRPGTATDAPADPPATPEGRLFRLKRAIVADAYRVDPQRVARKLLKRG